MVPVRQELSRAPLADPAGALGIGLAAAGLPGRAAGGRVAVAVGSRGIDSLVAILGLLAERLSRAGCAPFVVPAMGSHGGATAGGQERLLGFLGISARTVGMPVESSMDVVPLGETPGGALAYVNRLAFESDAIVVVNRVGPHTGYSGPVQSGVVKMTAVGLGSEAGAVALHRHGFGAAHLIGEVADLVLEKAPPVYAVAVVEDGARKLSRLEVMAGGEIRRREPELLEAALSMWPGLPLEEADVLVVDEMGKDISGTGMDPRVTGRGKELPPGEKPPFTAKRLVALSLTPGSAGNATGVGHADVITERLLREVDREVTRRNVSASGAANRAEIPGVAPTDRDAVSAALESLGIDPAEARVVRIKNTAELSRFQVSEALAREIEGRRGVTVSGPAREMEFDREGGDR